jgi:hypothetical protein
MKRTTRDIMVQSVLVGLVLIIGVLIINPSIDFFGQDTYPTDSTDIVVAQSNEPVRLVSREVENSEVRHSVKVLELTTNNPDYYITVIKAGNLISGIESIYNMREKFQSKTGHTVMGIINGNYWRAYSYNPIGPVIHNGEVVYLSTIKHWTSALFDEQNRLYIDTFKLDGVVRTKTDHIYRIYNVNLRLKKEGNIVYNSFAGKIVPHVTDAQARARARKSKMDVAKARKYLIEQTNELPRKKLICRYLAKPAVNREFPVLVQSVINNGFSPVPDSGCIISIGSDYESALTPREGDTLYITYRTHIHSNVAFVNGICGSPRIVREGQALPELETEKLKNKKFIEQTMRRTAIGTNRDKTKVYFVVVETGRKGNNTRGASLYDLANIMKSLGAWDAVNLDGGSSTAMLAFDENKNSLFRISGTRLSVAAAMVKKTKVRNSE